MAETTVASAEPRSGDGQPVSPLVFVHIPKTAGTSVRLMIERIYGTPSVFTCAQFRVSLERFRALAPAERGRYRVLAGHVAFGAHTLFPVPAATITFLRDPVERVVSLYSYARSEPTHPLYQRMTTSDCAFRTFLHEYKLPQANNGQTRFMAGDEAAGAPFGSCTGAMLDQAKRNLAEGCRVFGLVERMDESLDMMRRSLNWARLPVGRDNVTRQRLRREQLDPRDLDALHEANALDAELYRFALELFRTRLDRIAG